jgi:hypothetical protein
VGTAYPDLFTALGNEFEAREVRERNQGGRRIKYITARSVMNRLDEVFGPEHWKARYAPVGPHAIECRLTVRLPDGTKITKVDVGGRAGMADKGDDEKSGYSDALKRAAAAFGVGRYLYNDGVPEFGEDEPSPPGGNISTPPTARQDAAPPPQGQGQRGDPRTGRALFAWTKEMEQKHEVGLLKYINGWAKLQDYPGRMVDWDDDQVANALKECRRKLDALGQAIGEANAALGDGYAATAAPTPASAESAYIPDDRNPIPRPKAGKELYLSLNRLQDEHGCSLVKGVLDWCKGCGLPTELVNLNPDDLADAWRAGGTILARFQAKRAKQVDAAARLRGECREACRSYLAEVHGGEAGVTDAMVLKEIEGLHVGEFDGEVLTDWPSYGDVNRLKQMIRSFGAMKEDAAHAPAGL